MADGDKGMNQTKLQECHTWMSTVQRRVGAKKCQAAAPVDNYFVLALAPGRPDGIRNWPPNLLMITERASERKARSSNHLASTFAIRVARSLAV